MPTSSARSALPLLPPRVAERARAIRRAAHIGSRLARALAGIALAAVWLSGCGASLRRFPDRDPIWVDDDMRAFSPRPPEWYSPYVWDGVDNSTFRPLAEAFALELPSEAMNVNGMDEVPDSSWYVNRLSRHALGPEEVARGACVDLDLHVPGVDDDVPGPFTITRGKPDGSSPGFFVRDGAGRLYMMKPDGALQPERPSAADAISAAIFFAAGYHAPCNRVVYVRREDLLLDPEAELRRTDGRRSPLTREDVDAILVHAGADAEGRLRFSLSQFVDGEPIAPWTYEGTWGADPNDVMPHQHRREVRAMYVLSSWLSHIDSRQENTMASWMEGDDGRGYVRHYMIDFSDTLGILYPWEGLARRFGHSGYFDVQHIVEDFVSLGLVDRPWHHAEHGAAGSTLGYYDLERYVPDQWRPGYRNPAYERMTERDAAWMARIVARLSDAHLDALVARARFTDPIVRAELLRILRGRRDRALERWLTRVSPLTDPVVHDARLCVEDRAVTAGIRGASRRRYGARAYTGAQLREREIPAPVARGTAVCVELGSVVSPGEYLVVDLVVTDDVGPAPGPLRVHAYGRSGTLHVVGAERPGSAERPVP